MITTILALIFLNQGNFLDFTVPTRLSQVIQRFGNPLLIDDIDKDTTQFTFERSQYNFLAISDKNGIVTKMTAYGLNKSVSYRGVSLGSDFKTVVIHRLNPSFNLDSSEITLSYPDSEYVLTKMNKTWIVISISVFKPVKE